MDVFDLDKRVDHAVAKVDTMLDARFKQLAQIADEKIEQIRVLLNGIKITNVTSVESHEVKKAEAVNQ